MIIHIEDTVPAAELAEMAASIGREIRMINHYEVRFVKPEPVKSNVRTFPNPLRPIARSGGNPGPEAA